MTDPDGKGLRLQTGFLDDDDKTGDLRRRARDHARRSACASTSRRRSSCCGRPAPRSAGRPGAPARASSSRRRARRRRRSSRSSTATASRPCRLGGRQQLLRHRLRPHEHLRPGDRRAPPERARRRRAAPPASATRCPTSTSSCRAPTPTTSTPAPRLPGRASAPWSTNTTKPMVMTAEGVGDLEVMWKIACEAARRRRGAAAKPYFIMYGEPSSPLSHPVDSLDKLLFCADHGIPAIYSPAPLAGGTAPITVAGHIAQGVGRVAVRPRHPPAAQAGRAVPLRHRPGGARHGHVAVAPTTRPSTS